MLRLFNPRIMFVFSEATSPYQKYQIHQSKYVIEIPPKRPANAYALFVKHTTAGMKGLKITNITKTLAEQWNKMQKDDQVKSKFQKESDEIKSKYQVVKAEYAEKYEIPFKTNSYTTLFVKNLYQTKQIEKVKGKKLLQYAKEVGEKIKAISEQDKKKFQEQADNLNKERFQVKKKYELPLRKYDTLTYFITKNTGPKETITKERKEDFSKQYNEYVDSYKKELDSFCKSNGYEMTGEELYTMIEHHKMQKKQTRKVKAEEKKNQAESEISDYD